MVRKKITMRAKGGKIFDEGFESFIKEHCVIPNLRESTVKHYREIIEYRFDIL